MITKENHTDSFWLMRLDFPLVEGIVPIHFHILPPEWTGNDGGEGWAAQKTTTTNKQTNYRVSMKQIWKFPGVEAALNTFPSWWCIYISINYTITIFAFYTVEWNFTDFPPYCQKTTFYAQRYSLNDARLFLSPPIFACMKTITTPSPIFLTHSPPSSGCSNFGWRYPPDK